MRTIDISKDIDAHTMIVTTEFDHPIEKVWQLWADPRCLERWWGPPTYPATVTHHDLSAGGKVTYFMTGPEGDTPGGYWNVLAVEAPFTLDVVDGFADDQGQAIESLPTTAMSTRLAARPDGGTVVTITSVFPSVEAMEQMISMGMEDGLREAMGQMNAVLAG